MYKTNPHKTANNPFLYPKSLSNNPDSWNQDNIANIMPKEDKNNQINFFIIDKNIFYK